MIKPKFWSFSADLFTDKVMHSTLDSNWINETIKYTIETIVYPLVHTRAYETS